MLPVAGSAPPGGGLESSPVRAAIFDFDGVLVNSEPLHFRGLREALLPEGVAIGEAEYYSAYLSYDDRTAIRRALERHGVEAGDGRVEAVAGRKARLLDLLLRECPFFPGARELVRNLEREVPLAIASGALRHEIETVLRQGGLRGCFRAVVAADDVSRGKPDPEPYLAALAALEKDLPGLAPGDCLVFEDSVAGIAAARAAGMRVVAVTHSYPPARLDAAHRVVASLEGLGVGDLRRLFS